MFKLRFLRGITAVFISACFNLAVYAVETPLPADVRVLIDVSGSMKQNDPNNLRRPALELVVQLLQDDSKAGVWTFGRYINMMVPHRSVTQNWRDKAANKVEGINSLGLFTNIGAALEKAAYDLDKPNPQYRTSLILLTDGMVDISRNPDENSAEWRRIVDEVLPKLQQAGYTVHTIALSDNADTDLMNKLALGTDGITAVAKTAEDLMKIFLKAFDQAAPAEQVPLEGNRFVIDSSVEEFTALIFRSATVDTRLIGPDRTQYSVEEQHRDANWYRTDGYDLITIKQPLEGEWLVQADMDPDSRVTVVSDLNLLVKPLPNNIFRNEVLSLSLLLQEDGKTVRRAEFLRLLDINATVDQRQSDNVWTATVSTSVPPEEGIYSAELAYFTEQGHYDLQVVVDGKSFKREFSHTVSVHEPFGVEWKKQLENGENRYVITVSANGQMIDLSQTKVTARIKNPEGHSSVQPLSLTEKDNWQLQVAPKLQGQYQVALRVSGTDKAGQPFEFEPDTLRFQFPDGDDPFATKSAPKPELKPEPESKPEPKPELEPESKPELKPELEPKPEPEPKSEPMQEEEPTPEEEPEGAKWPFYVGLGVGNLLILVLAFFAYRMIMSDKGEDASEELEQTTAEADTPDDQEQSPESTDADVEPQMEEMAAEEPAVETDSDLASSLMAGDLDLASDTSTETEIDVDDILAADDLTTDAEESGEDDDDDDGFLLDDFDANSDDKKE